MNEKRFTINGKEIIQNKQVWCMANSEHCADVIATAMNELHEENEELKAEVYILQDDILNKRVRKLMEENKQLKSEIDGLEELLKSYRKTIEHNAELLADASKKGYLPPLKNWREL